MSVPANVDVILQGSAICASNPAIVHHTFICVAEALRQRCVLIFGGTKLCPVPPGGMRITGKASMATCSQIVSPCVTFATLTTWTVLTVRQRTRLIFRDIQGHSGTFGDIQGHSGTLLFCSTWVRPSQMAAEQTRQDYRWSGEACLPHTTWAIWVSTPTIWGIYDLLCPLVSCNAHAHTYTLYVIWIVFAFCEVLLS